MSRDLIADKELTRKIHLAVGYLGVKCYITVS
jgi:hypothetical protein